MTWIDNNGDIRPQSWEEHCRMEKTFQWSYAQPPQSDRVLQLLLESALAATSPSKRKLSGEQYSPIRLRLFRANPHCFWCGCVVYLDTLQDAINLATVDHLYSRLHPLRESEHKHQKNVLHVLACRICNQERAQCEERGRMFLPKLKERWEHARLADATVAKAQIPFTRKSTMRAICTLEEAVAFTGENPSR